jgi:hypothetical protein
VRDVKKKDIDSILKYLHEDQAVISVVVRNGGHGVRPQIHLIVEDSIGVWTHTVFVYENDRWFFKL